MRLAVLILVAFCAVSVRGFALTDGDLSTVGIEQNVGALVPLDLPFTDDTGRAVQLGEFFRGRPAILAFAYHSCPNLCGVTLNGLVEGVRGLTLTVGRDFDIVVVSIDPSETPAVAAETKRMYSTRYGRPGSPQGWHFLTGTRESIERLAGAVGFRYRWDPESRQFAHASGLLIVTPQGRVSRYFLGIEYPSRDLSGALAEAGSGRIGRAIDQFLLLCFHYNPTTGRYGLVITRAIQIAGLGTVLLLGGMLFALQRRARRQNLGPPC